MYSTLRYIVRHPSIIPMIRQPHRMSDTSMTHAPLQSLQSPKRDPIQHEQLLWNQVSHPKINNGYQAAKNGHAQLRYYAQQLYQVSAIQDCYGKHGGKMTKKTKCAWLRSRLVAVSRLHPL